MAISTASAPMPGSSTYRPGPYGLVVMGTFLREATDFTRPLEDQARRAEK
jgi:hypothetical protein